MFDEANLLRTKGRDIISLALGEPDFNTPPHIIDAMVDAARSGSTHYTANKGIVELRQAICSKLLHDHNIHYNVDEIIATVGVTEGVFIALTSFLDPGDEVLIPDPTWLNYIHVPVLNGAIPVVYTVSQENNFQISIDEVKKKITKRTKMIVILDPSNPTGGVQTKETLSKVAELALEHDLLVLSDEIYGEIIFDDNIHYSIAKFPGMKERTVLLNGFSKAYAMTGWRLGYVAASQKLIDVMNRLHSFNVTSTATMVQWGGVAALNGTQEPMKYMVKEFQKRRDFLVEALNGTKGLNCLNPGGTFYVFPKIRGIGMSGDEYANYLLHEAGVAVVPGSVFGSHGTHHVRLSCATSMDELTKAADRIYHATEKLPGY
ncbi:MAG: pyridoxal phosphate-dependent aminotransferase [Firmicutes bacterium]|nr:pyridoxal phosphate-dependent aminotransferase [Bacillota bacterium]